MEVPNTLYGMFPNGWIDQEIFTEWLQKLYSKHTIKCPTFMDGHFSHFNPRAIRITAEAEISLPLYTTHVAQPLNVSFLDCLKALIKGVPFLHD